MTHVVRSENLCLGYGRDEPVITEANITINSHDFVFITGKSGSGKSTLLKTIYGVAKVFRGSVVFDSRDVTWLPPEAKTALGMGFVPQTDNVFPDLTVEENLEMGGYLLKDVNKLREAMEVVYSIFPQLRELRHVLAGALSGGQRKMVAVGRALMTMPKLLLMDEPTAGLAPKTALELLDKLMDIKRETNASILIVEQHARRALEISDRGYVLVSGRIAAEGSGREILSRPDLQELFLGKHG
jgi:ABC-type branched-subunit amino acid transport system ATPase component